VTLKLLVETVKDLILLDLLLSFLLLELASSK
jgi:hypothetical protein